MKNIIFILPVILIISCISNNVNTKYNETVNGWLNIPDNDEFYYSEPLNIQIEFIEMNKLDEARILLQENFYIKLSNEEYFYFSGNIKTNNKNAYLIRSVNYSFNESGYKIYISKNNNLLISHRVLSQNKNNNYQKWPIIIFYDNLESIKKIYTSYSVAR